MSNEQNEEWGRTFWASVAKGKSTRVYGVDHYEFCGYALYGSAACTCRNIDQKLQIRDLEARLAAKEQELEALRDGLRLFGVHMSDCGNPCTCGLDAALTTRDEALQSSE